MIDITAETKKAVMEFNDWLGEFLSRFPSSKVSELKSFLTRNGVLDFVSPLSISQKESAEFDAETLLSDVVVAATRYLRSDFSGEQDILLQMEIQRRKRVYVDYCLGYLAGFLRTSVNPD